MRKIIIPFVLILIMSSAVFAWGAARAISGNQVTVTIDETGGTGIFTVQETVSGAAIATYPSNCGLAGNILTCDSDDSTKRIIIYQTTGSGTVAGIISGGFPSSQKDITGDSVIGSSASPQIKINEIEANPAGTDSGNEWLELYNPTSSPVNLTGWKVVDIGNTTVTITGTINANGYLIIDSLSLSLVNTDETVTLKDPSNIAIDTAGPFSDSADDEKTQQRVPDGTSTWIFKAQTKGATNGAAADTTPPVISGVSAAPLARSADVSWTTNENSNSIVHYGTTTVLGSQQSISSMVASHSVALPGLTASTLYYYTAESCDSSNNCATSTQSTFTTTAPSCTDDLMPNYVRGKITLNGANAAAGIQYTVIVKTGLNAGATYSGQVDDSKVPIFFRGRGYFDTGDNICFSTGDTFEITVLGYNGMITGTFQQGGNGDFSVESTLPTGNFIPKPQNPPTIDSQTPSGMALQVAEGSSTTFSHTSSDVDSDILSYTYKLDGAIVNSGTGTSGSYTYNPGYSAAGDHNMDLEISDGRGGTDTVHWDITVTNTNRDPTIILTYNPSVLEGQAHTISVQVTDPDTDDRWTYYRDGAIWISSTTSKVQVFTWTPTQERVGEVDISFRVQDNSGGYGEQVAHITVVDVPEAPTVSGLPDKTIQEDSGLNNNLFLLESYASDPETPSNSLIYTITSQNNTAVVDCAIDADHYIDCTTQPEQSGKSTVTVQASDGSLTASDSFVITVIAVDDPAVWSSPLADQTIGEDSPDGTTVYSNIKPLCTDIDNAVNIVATSMPGQYTLYVDGNDLKISNMEHNYFDNGGLVTVACNGIPATFTLTITNTNDAPVITSYYPNYNPIIGEDGSQEFRVTYTDADLGDPHTLVWTVNGVPMGTGGTFVYHGANLIGRYTRDVVISVSDPEDTVTHEWTLTETSCPIADTFTVPEDLCSLAGWQLANYYLILENQYGKIEWLEPVDLTDVLDLDSTVLIAHYLAGVDISTYPQLDSPVRITLYQLSYTDDPAVLYTDDFTSNKSEITEPCDICNMVDHTAPPTTNGIAVFEAENLGTFYVFANKAPVITSSPVTIAYSGELYQYDVDAYDEDGHMLAYSLALAPAGMTVNSGSGLINWIPASIGNYSVELEVRDSHGGEDTQSFNINARESPKLRIKNIEAEVDGSNDKDVGNGETVKEEAKPHSSVEFSIEVENRYTSDITIEDVEVTATIEGIDDGEDLEESAEIGDIKHGKSKSEKISFILPLKVDEDLYSVKILAEGEDENGIEYTDEWTVYLELKKDKHGLVLRDIGLSPSTVNCQKNANLEFTLTNIGSEDEDSVRITIYNTDLGINKAFDDIELDAGSDDESDYQNTYSIKMDGVKEGEYPITLKAYYDGKSADEETVELKKGECKAKLPATEEEPEETAEPEESEEQETAVKETTAITKKAPVVIPMYYRPKATGTAIGPGPTTITFRESSSTYIFLMVLLIILLSGAALFAFGVIISGAKKRR